MIIEERRVELTLRVGFEYESEDLNGAFDIDAMTNFMIREVRRGFDVKDLEMEVEDTTDEQIGGCEYVMEHGQLVRARQWSTIKTAVDQTAAEPVEDKPSSPIHEGIISCAMLEVKG